MKVDNTETRELIDQASAGDAEAFCELCRVHEGRLFRQAMVLCGNESQAADLAQDTLVEGWKSIHRYRRGCLFFTWLCSILIHRHRNVVRRKQPIPFSSLTPDDKAEMPDALQQQQSQATVSTPDQALAIEENNAVLLSCLERLPPKQRAVIFLRFFIDATLTDIATTLGCSLGTVKSRLFHAMEKLSQMKELQRINS